MGTEDQEWSTYLVCHLLGGFITMKRMEEMLTCKYCGSKRVVKFGHYQHVQRWWCKECRRKFVDNDALPKMQTPIAQIASALSTYFEGISLNGIRRHLQQDYNNYPSDSTVYGWIVRFSKVAVNAAHGYSVKTGPVWVADETVLSIGGQNIWLWDILDRDTRFLLATHFFMTRTSASARVLMQRAAERATSTPRVIITGKLSAYLEGIEQVFGADTRHIQSQGFKVQPNTNIIESFHSTLKARTKVMRGLKGIQSAKLITDAWLVHYNFFRPHEGLGGITPATAAGVRFPFRNWADVVRGGY
jgi:transposase-like protein